MKKLFSEKNKLHQIIQWICAAFVACLIMNFVLAFYNRAAGWIDRSGGSTLSIYNPGSSFLMGTEGRGFHRIDKRGYVNDVDVLAENYVVVVGASYTQGKEVDSGERYTDLLNEWLGYTDEAYVYNVSQDAYYFPKIVAGFTALVSEFPDSGKIVIETGRTDYTSEELENALDQRVFNENHIGENILSTLSVKKKISILLKEYSPLLYNINNKVKAIKEIMNNDAGGAPVNDVPEEAEERFDLDAYTESMTKDIELITSVYDGEIIILFHPSTIIEPDGSLTVVHSDTDEIFKQICGEYGITVVDMTEKFLSEYEENHVVPYGFSNTSLGGGHFNTDGHRMIAEELMSYLR